MEMMYGKRASKDVLFGIAGYGADKVLLAVLLASVFLFVFWPMLCILIRSLWDGKGISYDTYAAVWNQYREISGTVCSWASAHPCCALTFPRRQPCSWPQDGELSGMLCMALC